MCLLVVLPHIEQESCAERGGGSELKKCWAVKVGTCCVTLNKRKVIWIDTLNSSSLVLTGASCRSSSRASTR